MMLILGRLLISEHGLCYLFPQSCCFTLCLSVLIVKENFPDSFYSPFYPLSECDFSSASLNYAVLDNVGLNCTGPLIIGFFSWPVCVARYVCVWIFLAVLYPALHRTWNVKNFHWSQLTVIFPDPWAQVLPGDSVCWRGGYRFSQWHISKQMRILFFFPPLAWF